MSNANKIPAARREAFCVRTLNRAFTAVVKAVNATKDDEVKQQMRSCYETVYDTYEAHLKRYGTHGGTLRGVLTARPTFIEELETACNEIRSTSSMVRNAARYKHTWPEPAPESAPESAPTVQDVGHS